MTAALAAGRRSMDWVGVALLGCVTALGGGSARDVLLGHYPLSWVANPWLLALTAGAALATIALAVGTTYLLKHAPRRVYALCTALPLVFVIVTVFTAGIESIRLWMQELALSETTAAQAFSLKLNCTLAGVMLVLSAVIAVDAVRRWYVLLANGVRPPEAQPGRTCGKDGVVGQSFGPYNDGM